MECSCEVARRSLELSRRFANYIEIKITPVNYLMPPINPSSVFLLLDTISIPKQWPFSHGKI
jgi:hypothetical protein